MTPFEIVTFVPGVNVVWSPVRSTSSTPLVTERFAGFTLEMKLEALMTPFEIVTFVPGVNVVWSPVKSTASTPLVTERFAGLTLEMKFEAEIVLFAIVMLVPGVKVSCFPERSTDRTLRLDIERGLCGVNVWPTLNTPLLERAKGGSTDCTKPAPPELLMTPF